MVQEIKRIIKDSEILKCVFVAFPSSHCHRQPPAAFTLTGRFDRILLMMNVHREDDTKWPQKNKDGRQELEIRLGSEHISFEVSFDSRWA